MRSLAPGYPKVAPFNETLPYVWLFGYYFFDLVVSWAITFRLFCSTSPILGAVLLMEGDPTKKVVLKVPIQWSTPCSVFASRPHLGRKGPVWAVQLLLGGGFAPPDPFLFQWHTLAGCAALAGGGFAPPPPVGLSVIKSIPLSMRKKGSAHEPEAFK